MHTTDLRDWLHNELFERVPSNIAIIDREYRIIEANQNFRETFGEWQGKLCHNIFRNRCTPCSSCKAEQTFNDGQSRVSEESRLNRHGDTSYYVVNFEPIISQNGDIPYIIEMSKDVTKDKRLQREHDILFDRVPCYVTVLNRDMKIVRNNEMFRKTFGENPEKKCFEMYQKRTTPCEDCPALKTFSDGQIHTASKSGVNKNGETIFYHVTTSSLNRREKTPTHVIEMSLDITATRQLEKRLNESFDFQASLIKSAMDSIIAADQDGIITLFNPSAEKLFNYDAAEVINQIKIDQFVPPDFIDVISQGKNHCVLAEAQAQNRDKQNVPVRFSGVVLKSEEKHLGSAAFFQDLRDIKKLEHDKLEAERLAAVGQTVAGLAHGIKNVLMGLDGGMYVIQSGMNNNNTELTHRGWEMLQNNIERISLYVKDFLNFAKGQQSINVTSIDPLVLAQDVFELFKNVAHKAGINLMAELSETVTPANMDYEGIHTCLVNLVSNALDACEISEKSGGNVILRLLDNDETLIFEVCDDGCGMDYEIKKKVFTTFFSTKGSTKGTGLGLLVTRRITQEHGGRITLESTESKGSVFRLEFPRKRLPPLTEMT